MLIDGLITMCVDISMHNILYDLRLEKAKVLFLVGRHVWNHGLAHLTKSADRPSGGA